MFIPSTRTVVVLAILLHNILAFSQNPDCPKPTFFKTLGAETQSEYATVIAQSNDGNLYLAGRRGAKTFIQKTSLAGDAIWLREFQLSPFEAVTPAQIFEDSEGMIVGCGTQTLFAGATRGYVFRYDALADTIIWARLVTSNNPSAAGILEKTPGGSFIYYQNPVFAGGETDIEILDLERATGNIIPAFASRYEHISYDVLSKMISVEGSLYGLGASAGRQGTLTDARRVLLTRFDPVNGMPVWSQLSHLDTNATVDMYGRDLVADGDELVAAYEANGDSTDPGAYHLYLQKTDLDGNMLWVRRYEFTAGILKLLAVPDGYLVYGQQKGNEHLVLKTNKNGIPIWTKRLTNGPVSSIFVNNFTPNQAIQVADSLYLTGLSTSGLSDVFFWKMLADGSMADSCGFVDSLDIQSTEVLNPVRTVINLQPLLSTAVLTVSTLPLTANTLDELLICPDCSVPNPCPEGNDFVMDILDVSCSGGFVTMNFSICELAGGMLPDLSIAFYNANPFTQAADKIGEYNYNATNPDSCTTVQLTNLENLFGPSAVQNGFQLFAIVNDFGTTNTPISLNDFPLADLEECDYTNNLDSFTIQLPSAPTLNLGADQTICANETATLNAGSGYIKYQWSNGATTQNTNVNFAGSYRVTVTDACGFKQSDTINLQVRQLAQFSASGGFCPGKSVTIHGFTFDQVGTFQKNISGVNGDCDTSATFFITELPYEERIEMVFFCPFTTVTINGVTYEDSGIARDTVPSSVGCDTLVLYFLNQLPLPFRFYDIHFCPGDSVVFNGNVYYQSVSFTDTLLSSGFGCDTVAYVDIKLDTLPEITRTIQFCPGTSVDINGQSYTMPGEVLTTIPSTNGGCDTLATFLLEWLPAVTLDTTIQFCPGSSVDIEGQTYTQPGTVLITIPGNGVDCDLVVTYNLEWLPSPTRFETVSFCPGTSVTIGGNAYTQPGTVVLTQPGAAGTCDTVVTYTLQFSPLPTRAETLEFCQGESITLGGQTYTQPTTVTLTAAGTNNNCDTLVTYTLQYLSPGPSTLSLVCPPIINVATVPGTGALAVTYTAPVASSDCECPGNTLALTSGLSSGSLFPVGTTEVCFAAQDKCGSAATCCFNVTVREELACDTKTTSCIKYELLGITTDPQQQYTYKVRVTNNCSGKLIYTAIQLPDGLNAVSPLNLSTYTSPDGRNYAIRNPNYSPFYSIRFKSTTDSISNGESDVFEYTLPAQSHPTYIHIISRLTTQSFYETHLNTFNCPVSPSPSQNRGEEAEINGANYSSVLSSDKLLLFPNPSTGALFADLSGWQGESLNLHVLDSRGQRVQSLRLIAENEPQSINLASQLAGGLYFLEIVTESGERAMARFVLQR